MNDGEMDRDRSSGAQSGLGIPRTKPYDPREMLVFRNRGYKLGTRTPTVQVLLTVLEL